MLLRGLRLSDDLKTRLEQAQKLRGYRSVNAFILEAIEEELQRNGHGRVRFGVRGANRRRLQPGRARSSFRPQYSTGSARAAGRAHQMRVSRSAQTSSRATVLAVVHSGFRRSGTGNVLFLPRLRHEVNAVAVFFLAMPQHTPLNMGCFSEVCHGQR